MEAGDERVKRQLESLRRGREKPIREEPEERVRDAKPGGDTGTTQHALAVEVEDVSKLEGIADIALVVPDSVS